LIRLANSLSVVALAVMLLSGGAAHGEPTAKQVLEKGSRHFEIINDYTVDARLKVESPSVHVPEMLVKIYYKKPDKLHIDSKDGFAVLPRQGIVVGNPLRDLMEGSDLSMDRSEKALGEDCYLIKGSFQREGRAVQSTVWIDKKKWLVRQMCANPEWGPSVKVKLWYSKVGGRYWLPTATAAQVSIPPIPGSQSDQRAKPVPTLITIKFTDYRVNTGLSDKIFQETEGRK